MTENLALKHRFTNLVDSGGIQKGPYWFERFLGSEVIPELAYAPSPAEVFYTLTEAHASLNPGPLKSRTPARSIDEALDQCRGLVHRCTIVFARNLIATSSGHETFERMRAAHSLNPLTALAADRKALANALDHAQASLTQTRAAWTPEAQFEERSL